MKVLIVESDPGIGKLWQRHMQRQGLYVRLVVGQKAAVAELNFQGFDVIVLNLVLEEGSALAISDLVSYRHPDTAIIFVTNTSFFSDGSIFSLCANACSFLQSDTAPEDLAAVVAHYGQSGRETSESERGYGVAQGVIGCAEDAAAAGAGGSAPLQPRQTPSPRK